MQGSIFGTNCKSNQLPKYILRFVRPVSFARTFLGKILYNLFVPCICVTMYHYLRLWLFIAIDLKFCFKVFHILMMFTYIFTCYTKTKIFVSGNVICNNGRQIMRICTVEKYLWMTVHLQVVVVFSSAYTSLEY